jgi:hypothetical protein
MRKNYFQGSDFLRRSGPATRWGRTKAVLVFLYFLIILAGCGASSTPLSIEMYNPETKQTLTCTARDQLGWADTSVLGAVVEGCAKQLEARGFVRAR